MSVLLHLSDTHFGTEQAPVVEALAALTHQLKPDLLVLTGDITQRARPGQFQAARSFMDRLAAPRLAIAGNHDIPLFNLWARLWRPYAHHAAAFGHDLEPVFRSADLLVVGVNTTRPWRHKHGQVSAAQVDRVVALLERADAAQLRVVAVHQPAAVIRPEDRVNRLRGSAAALQRWSAAGADLVLGGHIHLPYVVAPPGLARAVWVVQAGTAVSNRLREAAPNSINVVRWGVDAPAGRCTIERWDHFAAAEAFARTAVMDVMPQRP
jgi:3',5'-cyclic AMP phosphodiesterase CpdA